VFTLLRVCEVLDIPVDKLVGSVAYHLREREKE
jgi:hypothetical protein